MTLPPGLVVWGDSPEDSQSAKLARRLGVGLVLQEEPPNAEWMLFYDDEQLYLHSGHHPDFRPFAIDYLGGEFARRWRSATKNDILCKAIGLKKGVRSICDPTCGLGFDAFFLSTFHDTEVTLCERNPVAAELVIDALSRVKDTGRFENKPIFFHFGDGRDFLRARPDSFDAVYLDPMYPREEEKTAKQRKEMLLFRELVGQDFDAGELFALAWLAARKRVVVKRPDDAAPLVDTRPPDYVVPGKTVRFDIYLKPSP